MLLLNLKYSDQAFKGVGEVAQLVRAINLQPTLVTFHSATKQRCSASVIALGR
jgi:hypothetical protein